MAEMTQLERCALSVSQRLRKERPKLTPKDALRIAFAICTKSLQKKGYLKPGTHTPTVSGQRRSKALSRDVTAQRKKKAYERVKVQARVKPKAKPKTKKARQESLQQLLLDLKRG